MDLYPFQKEGVRELLRRRCVLLADDMGLGKTVQAATAIRSLTETGAIQRTLIICPASLCLNWKRELERWANMPAVLYQGSDRYGMLTGNARILISSYDTATGDLRRDVSDGDRFLDIGLDLLILDEGQNIKTPDSLRARVLTAVLAARRWVLTGTPMENHPRELASILRFLYPNEFSERVFEPTEQLFALRDRCMVRRTKATVQLQLPSRTVVYLPVALSPDQQAEYEQAEHELRESVCGAKSIGEASRTLLAGLQALRRIACISSNGQSSKIELLEEEIGEIVETGEKAVIFSSFAGIMLPELARRLDRFGSLLFTGKMNLKERDRVHQRFVTDPTACVMCASLKAAGVGITWTVASYVYHADIWWNPQALRQAEDRVHRIGQNKPVIAKRLIGAGTIEEGIARLLQKKEAVFDFVVDQASAAIEVNRNGLADLLSLIQLRLESLPGV